MVPIVKAPPSDSHANRNMQKECSSIAELDNLRWAYRGDSGATFVNIFRLTLLVPLVLLLFGCSTTHVVSIKYEPTRDLVIGTKDVHPVKVGNFADNRGTDSRWLGAIRGGYGNVLKKLLTDESTSTSAVVQAAFVAALAARKIPDDTPTPAARVTIEGVIDKLDCSYFFNREAHAHLQVNVVSLPSRTLVFSQSYRTDNTESGVGAGIFGDPTHLAQFEQRTLNQTIDKVFADPAFIAALTNPPISPGASPGGSIAERLRSLDRLKKDGLITNAEYEAKRKEILGNL